MIADCYRDGKGVKRDKRLAKELYREAAAAGNEEAKETHAGAWCNLGDRRKRELLWWGVLGGR